MLGKELPLIAEVQEVPSKEVMLMRFSFLWHENCVMIGLKILLLGMYIKWKSSPIDTTAVVLLLAFLLCDMRKGWERV